MSQTAGPFVLSDLREHAAALLRAAGATAEDAAIVADEVVDAEARGYEAQGLLRLPAYVRALQDGSARSPVTLTVLRDSPSALAWDATGALGHPAALQAMEACVERAAATGACFGIVREPGHIGRLGYYVERAAAKGAIGIIACSGGPSSATMAPWGAREARLGTNPIAFGFPGPGPDHVVVDVSTTQAARGKVLVAAATGQSIPDSWAFDADGNPTTDPTRALPPAGTLAPLGGHKGYALAVVVDLLCGALGGPYPPAESVVFVAAFDVASVTTAGEYATAVRSLEELVRSAAPRPGFEGGRLPGTGAGERLRAAEAGGLHVAAPLWEAVRAAGASVGVADLEPAR
jgi:LDH2 family malate/lactate/ureidoglycolate dehydrogenase